MTFSVFASQYEVWTIAERQGMKAHISPLTGPMEVVSAMLRKHRYLGLAYAMHYTRGDWSEGFWRVEKALNALRALPDQTEQDKAIIKNIQAELDSGEEDGRIFRDCEWNYDRLLALLPEQDYKDYTQLMTIRDEWEKEGYL